MIDDKKFAVDQWYSHVKEVTLSSHFVPLTLKEAKALLRSNKVLSFVPFLPTTICNYYVFMFGWLAKQSRKWEVGSGSGQ